MSRTPRTATLGSDRLTKDGAPTLWYQDAVLGIIYRRGAFSGSNALPTVTLTGTLNNPTAPATITLIATAADSDGSIAKVEFYNGTSKLGEATASPYAFTWQNVPAGDYRPTARAIDDVGGATDSGAVNLSVGSSTGGTPFRLRAQWLTGRSIRLTLEGDPGAYIIGQSTNLKDWSDIYPITIPPGGSGSIDDSGGPQNMPVLFYRARKE